MAGGIFDIGVSGLLSNQRAIATTGHNIANVNTEGYSRQRVEFDSRIPQQQGYGFLGTGVELTTIERMYDQFAVKNLQTQTSLSTDLEVYHQFSSQIDNLLANPEAGLSPTLQEFFNSVQGVTDDPSSIPPRQVMLSQGQSLTDRFQYIYDRMDGLFEAANSQIRMTVDEINSLASSIADLNVDISLQEGLAGGQPANDLRDQRDGLIRQLSEKVSTNVLEQDDGALNVFIGTGQSLVVGGRALSLSVTPNEFDPTQNEITLSTGSGSGVIVTRNISGGSLGGMLRFDQEILQPAINQLGLVATGLIESFNEQHQLGQDLNGQLGGDFFTQTSIDVRPGNNAGAATVSATFANVDNLTGSDYLLRYDGGTAYTLTRLTDNSTFAVDTAVPASLTVDGFSLAVGGGAAAVGDEFKIRPTRYAARDIALSANDPRQIAVAGPSRGIAAITNLGTGQISDVTVSNVVQNSSLTISGFADLTAGETLSLDINNISIVSAAHDGTADGSVGPNPGAAAALAAAIQTEINTNNHPWTVSEAGGVITLSTIDGSALNLDELTESLDADGNPTSITVTATGNSVNSGDGILEAGQADGIDVQAVYGTVLPLSSNNGDITLTFDASVPGFVISDGAFSLPAPTGFPGSPVAYNPVTDSTGVTVSLAAPYNGISFSLTGTPADGDTFTITDNTAGVSDNRNGLLLAQIQTNSNMLGGTADLQSTYAQLVAEVGTKTHQADINSKAQNVLLRQAVDARETVSGVNLDEEAANLLKYQQAYQAAAQVITTANELFDSLLNAVR